MPRFFLSFVKEIWIIWYESFFESFFNLKNLSLINESYIFETLRSFEILLGNIYEYIDVDNVAN